MRAGERAAEDGEVLHEDVDGTAVDRAPARDDAIARNLLLLHAEVLAVVLDEHVELLEGAVVEKKLDALARRQLAARVLCVDALLPAAKSGDLPALLKLANNLFHSAP